MDRVIMRLKKRAGELEIDNPQDAAEHNFALAMIYKNQGQDELAAIYGREAILLFDKCRMEELEECAAINISIEGVGIPGIIHQEVVKKRLMPIQL